jgi:hypothetical protein
MQVQQPKYTGLVADLLPNIRIMQVGILLTFFNV